MPKNLRKRMLYSLVSEEVQTKRIVIPAMMIKKRKRRIRRRVRRLVVVTF
jgi:hypothetical protein